MIKTTLLSFFVALILVGAGAIFAWVAPTQKPTSLTRIPTGEQLQLYNDRVSKIESQLEIEN